MFENDLKNFDWNINQKNLKSKTNIKDDSVIIYESNNLNSHEDKLNNFNLFNGKSCNNYFPINCNYTNESGIGSFNKNHCK